MTRVVNIAQSGGNNVTMRNRVINGNMMIDQRNSGASVTPVDAQFALDRWKCRLNQASKFSVQQNAGSVTPPVGFPNYLGVTSLSSFSPASGDYFNIQQPIEAFNFADLGWGTANAKSVTLSFQVYSSLTGLFGGRLINSAGNRVYPFTYTVSSTNTWTTISITIAGDTTGSWAGATNGIGVSLAYDLGSGSAFETASPNAWGTADVIRTSSCVRVIGTNGATFYITGVQLEAGTTATPFEQRLYGTELALCQRYYQKSFNQDTAPGTATHIGGLHVVSWSDGNAAGFLWQTAMRAAPTVTFYPTNSTTAGSVNSGGADRAASATYQSERGVSYINVTSGAANTYTRFQWIASAEL